MKHPSIGIRFLSLCALWVGALGLGGCPIGNNKYPKPSELDPAWKIDKLRVLAVRAEPPEVRPGELVRFEALVADPNGESGATVWLACPPDDAGGIGFGCAIDPSFDFTQATPDELLEAGFIGFEPLLPPTYVPDPTLLDGLDEVAATEGVYVLVQVAVLPQSLLDGGLDGAAFDFNQVAVAYKRLVVSRAPTPNNNPVVARFTVDGVPVAPDTVVEIDRGERYAFGLELESGSVEVYDYTNAEGQTELRSEEPYVHWYTDGGAMGEEYTLYPYLDADWEAPPAEVAEGEDPGPDHGQIWAVVRDRRGGMTWGSIRWRVHGTDTGAP